jgi:hypothetical protein
VRRLRLDGDLASLWVAPKATCVMRRFPSAPAPVVATSPPGAESGQRHLIEHVVGGLPGAPITTRPLRIDERVLHLLTGLDRIDERLSAAAKPIAVDHTLVPTHQHVADRIVATWTRHRERAGAPVVVLYGPDASSARAIAAMRARGSIAAHVASDSFIPTNQTDLHLFITLWERGATRVGGTGDRHGNRGPDARQTARCATWSTVSTVARSSSAASEIWVGVGLRASRSRSPSPWSGDDLDRALPTE